MNLRLLKRVRLQHRRHSRRISTARRVAGSNYVSTWINKDQCKSINMTINIGVHMAVNMGFVHIKITAFKALIIRIPTPVG